MGVFSKLFGRANNESKDGTVNAGIAGAIRDNVDSHAAQLSEHYIQYDLTDYLTNLPKHGTWEGEIGNSVFHPQADYIPGQKGTYGYNNMGNQTMGDLMSKHNGTGIPFKGNEIDFKAGGYVKAEVRFEEGIGQYTHGTSIRTSLHDEFYKRVADEWGCSVEDVIKYKEQNNLVVHECADTKTVQMVPREIHDNINHDGGVKIEKLKHQGKLPINGNHTTTISDTIRIANRAGVQAAKTGGVIGGAFSFVGNTVSYCKGEISLEQAATNITKDTATAAARSYVTGAGATLLKAGLQKSSSTVLKGIAKGNTPAMIVSGCIDVGISAVKLAKGQINGTEFLVEIGKSASNNLCAGVMASVGQVLIPVPVVGGFIGAMVGYTISNTFYTALVDSAKEAKLSKREYEQVKKDCEQLRNMILQYQKEMNAYVEQYFNDFKQVMNSSFEQMNYAVVTNDIDAYIQGANNITEYLGGEVQWRNKKEFDDFMNDESKSLIL